MNRTTVILTFIVALAAGPLAPEAARADEFTSAIACCSDYLDPSSCIVPESPNDLGECLASDDTAKCLVDGDGIVIECWLVVLDCCSREFCSDYPPGMACVGDVVATPIGQCCQCIEGEPFSVCEVELSESCAEGWSFGPLVCEG